MICTAMVQVDCCGWVVCNKPAEAGAMRCTAHADTHAIEKMLDDELFSILSSRIRMSIAKQVRDAVIDSCIEDLKEVREEAVEQDPLVVHGIDACISRLEVLK